MSKVLYFSRDNRPKTEAVPTGDGYEKEYGIALEENGHKVLKETGKTNAYALIQTYAEECKIENILQRAVMDPSVLERKQAMYDDFTDAPKSLFEAQNLMIEMENLWGSLTPEEREEYNGELSQFIAAVGTEKWFKTMGMIEDEIEEPTIEEPIKEKGGEE